MTSYFNKLKSLQKKAYAPYSKFHVASILVLENGIEYPGVNVENASYGGTICAERAAFINSISNNGSHTLYKELHLLAGNGENFPMPCGLCRQFIDELVPKDFTIIVYNERGDVKTNTIEELLPYAFSKEKLI